MPWLLYRYLLGDLLRVFGLTASVLVLVTAFGAAIKPLAAEDLMGPLQTGKYIALAIVPMLQFAMPFAAGFAATIVLHRMTSDNEILAAAASGISYRRILYPIVGLGVALLIVMVLLTQWIIPRFWVSIERIIALDVTRMVQTSIAKGRPVRIGSYQIYADRLFVQDDPPGTDAETRMVLFRVVLAELDASGRIISDVAARQAVVDVYRRDNDTYLMLAVVDAVGYDGKSGNLIEFPELQPPDAFPVPSSLHDDPVFMSQPRLLRLREQPDAYIGVQRAKAYVAESMQASDVREHLREQIRASGRVELSSAWRGKDHRLTVFADRFAGDDFSNVDDRPIEVRDAEGGRLVRRMAAAHVGLTLAATSTLAEPAVDLLLSDCEVADLRAQGAVNRRAQLKLPELSLPGFAGGDPSELPYRQLLERARGYGVSVTDRAEFLEQAVAGLRREIDSRLMRRYALSLTALLLILLGATLAMWLRHSLPLVIYVWAFVPSIANIMLISSGDHMIQSGLTVSGTIVMWSGNALLLLISLVVFLRLMRN